MLSVGHWHTQELRTSSNTFWLEHCHFLRKELLLFCGEIWGLRKRCRPNQPVFLFWEHWLLFLKNKHFNSIITANRKVQEPQFAGNCLVKKGKSVFPKIGPGWEKQDPNDLWPRFWQCLLPKLLGECANLVYTIIQWGKIQHMCLWSRPQSAHS